MTVEELIEKINQLTEQVKILSDTLHTHSIVLNDLLDRLDNEQSN